MKISRFTDLHCHTDFSIMDGLSTIQEIVTKAKNDGRTHVAITDHGNLFSVPILHDACKKAKLQPIYGCEIYMEALTEGKDGNHLVLIVKNEIGYRNLVELVTLGYDNIINKRPNVTWADLMARTEGLICLTACLGGEVARRIVEDREEDMNYVLDTLQEFFGDDLYLEIQDHNTKEELKVQQKLAQVSKKRGLKLVATGDSHYLEKDDSIVHEINLCLQTGSTFEDENRLKFPGSDYHFQTESEMVERFKRFPEAIENTQEIVKKIDFKLKLGAIEMPKSGLPDGFKEEKDYLRYLCEEGLKKKIKEDDITDVELYEERMAEELSIIEKMEFEGYFLIVEDFIRYAKEKGILVGPGRGSCAGSLVCYVIEITDIDPMKYDLLFERFLNPERVSNPDMDIDFDNERREEVVSYVREKYGEECVSGIVTFGKFALKGGMRDVIRVLNHPRALGDKLSKLISNGATSLNEALKESQELRELYEENSTVKEVLDLTERMSGRVRNISTHACGKVISPCAVTDFMPEMKMKSKEGDWVSVTQMTDVESMGLLKFDFLGLKTMSIIKYALKSINKKRASEGLEPMTYYDIPLDDTNAYRIMKDGNTTGVFQLESAGMRNTLKEVFADLDELEEEIVTEEDKKRIGLELFERAIATNALYRPGPMDYIPDYLEGMRNPKAIKYECPELESILSPTYGVIVFQEQVQMIVRKLAGFSLGRGDIIRRAMGKKKIEEMEMQKQVFIHGLEENGKIEVEGCLRRGISEEVALSVWSKMETFAQYAFNKSHSAAYSMIAVYTAWLKYYYPSDFLAACANTFIGDYDKLKAFMGDAKKNGIEILPPDVNKSTNLFVAGDNSIRFGFAGIKGIGNEGVYIDKAKEDGDFTGVQDFISRVSTDVSKSRIVALANSGAFSCFGKNRQTMHEFAMEVYSDIAKREKEKAKTGQFDMLDMLGESESESLINMKEYPEYPMNQLLELERECLGMYLTEHPLDMYSDFLNTHKGVISIYDIYDDEGGVAMEFLGEKVEIAGIVKDRVTRFTKNMSKLYTFTVEDELSEVNAVMFSNDIEQNVPFDDGDKVLISGTVQVNDFGVQIIVKNISHLEDLTNETGVEEIWLKFNGESDYQQAIKSSPSLKGVENSKEGNVSVLACIVDGDNKEIRKIKDIKLTTGLLIQIGEEFGGRLITRDYKSKFSKLDKSA